MNSSPTHLPVLVYLVGAPVLWGGNFIIADMLVRDLPGAWVNLIRWLIALLVILPICGASIVRHRAVLWSYWRNLTILAVLGVSSFNLVLYYALQNAPVEFAAVAFAATPLLTAGIDALIGRERPSTRLIVGATIAVAGMLLAQWQTLQLGTPPFGIFLVALASAIWSGYCVAIRRCPVPAPASALFPAQIMIGIAMMCPIVLVSGSINIGAISTGHWAGLAYLGICAAAIAFWAWHKAVLVVGPSQAAMFMNLVPISIVVLGVTIFDIRMTSIEYSAFALVLLGLAASWNGLSSRQA